MSLLLPLALLGLLTLPVILLLHFLRNRREQLAISSLRLWHNLQQQRHGGLPRYIPWSLMLFLQIIIAVTITFALARPVSSFLLDQPEHTIYVLDMTTSMTAIDVSQATSTIEPVRRFDVARQIVWDYIQTLDENDSFTVISLTPHPQVLLTGNVEQKTSALRTLDSLTPGATGANLPVALTLTGGLIDPNKKNRIIILTDGNYTLENQVLPPVSAPLEWQIIPSQPTDNSNQTLRNVSTRRLPDGRYRVLARVVNYSNASVARTLRLIVDGVVTREDPIEIEAEADVVKVWTLGGEAETAAVEIIEPDILPIDNRAELLLLSTAQRQILLVSEQPEILAKALEVQPGVKLTVRRSIDINNIPSNFDLIIFDSLPVEVTAWPRGNILIVNPPLGHSLLPAANYARNLRPNLETTSSLFAGTDLSGVLFNRVSHITTPKWGQVDLSATTQETESAIPLIFHGSVENSRVMVWAFDLTASNLPARLALPLLTGNMLSTLLATVPPSTLMIGESIELVDNITIEIPDGNRRFLDSNQTSASRYVFSATRQPGLYKIYNEHNVFMGGFAVHAGSQTESDLRQQLQPDTLTAIDVSATVAPALEMEYDEFWPWLAGLALIITLFEGWLAWRK